MWNINLIHVYALQLLSICGYIDVYVQKFNVLAEKNYVSIARQRLWIKYLSQEVAITFAKLFHWPSILMLSYSGCMSPAKKEKENHNLPGTEEKYSCSVVGAIQNRYQGQKFRTGTYYEDKS